MVTEGFKNTKKWRSRINHVYQISKSSRLYLCPVCKFTVALNVKENLPSLCFRKEFQPTPHKEKLFVRHLFAQLQTKKVAIYMYEN